MRFAVLLFPASLLCIPERHALAQAHHAATHDVGAVRFEVSCAPAVREDFDRAVALLHHMMYVEARQAFEDVARRAPDCAMAPWGVAMTLFQPLWPTRPDTATLRRGWDLVAHATSLGAGTERERALVAAAEAFYRDPDTADWWTRIRRWAAAMEEAYRARPDDVETGAFYALSQLAVGQVAGDRMAYQARAAALLLRIHERAPRHPGASHYTIHANDVDGRAGESLDIVRGYDDIAPEVPHALHMPTHIFVRLGDWPGVIEWNRKSADAALRLPAGNHTSIHYMHAMDYLIYANLQRGADAAATAALEEALDRGPYQVDFQSAFHLSAMPARYTVERRMWAEAAGLTPRTPAALPWDDYWWPEATTWFARGLGAARTGDSAGARAAAERMLVLERAAAGAGEDGFARYIRTDRLVLAGWIARLTGDADEALARMREAVEVEKTVQKHPVTPGALFPPYEALGDLLLELDRPHEALAAYEQSLTAWPKRFNSLLGAARAASAAGDEAQARARYAELLAVVGDVVTERAGVREARQVVR